MKKLIHAIYSENRGFLKLGRHIGRGFKKMILGGIFQYFLKIGVLFHMPRTNVLWHGFTKWRPRASFSFISPPKIIIALTISSTFRRFSMFSSSFIFRISNFPLYVWSLDFFYFGSPFIGNFYFFPSMFGCITLHDFNKHWIC